MRADYQNIKEPSDEELRKAFDEFDLNKNGTIEKNELRQFIYEMLQVPLEFRKDLDAIENKEQIDATAIVTPMDMYKAPIWEHLDNVCQPLHELF